MNVKHSIAPISDERLADLIRHGESFHQFNMDQDSWDMLLALYELRAFRGQFSKPVADTTSDATRAALTKVTP